MNEHSANAITVFSICGMIAVIAYSLSSCISSIPNGQSAQIECIKQRGNWSFWGTCSFDKPAEKKP